MPPPRKSSRGLSFAKAKRQSTEILSFPYWREWQRVLHDTDFAFTLAEVLITLGIIGIVAALTMPNIISNHQKKETVKQLKTAYSILSQAIESSKIDNGDIVNWDIYNLETFDFAEKYILPYLKIAKRCGTPVGHPISEGCFPNNDLFYQLDGTTISLGGCCRDPGWWDKSVLSNGMMIAISSCPNDDSALIFIDINGKKGQSILGKDMFGFKINPRYGFILGTGDYTTPYVDKFTRDELIHSTNLPGACNKNAPTTNAAYRGMSCSSVIAQDGWQIKDDYPWE